MTTKRTYYFLLALLALGTGWGYYDFTLPLGKGGDTPFLQGPICAWKITHKGRTSYLCGTVHLGRASWYPLPGVLEDAFGESEKLVVEVDIYDEVRGSHTMGMGKVLVQLVYYLWLQRTTPLSSRLYAQLGEEGYAALQARMKGCGFSFLERQLVNCAGPEQRRQFLDAFIRAHGMGMASYGVDLHFLQGARGAKMPIEALETMAYQLQLLRRLKVRWLPLTEGAYLGYMDREAKKVHMLLQG